MRNLLALIGAAVVSFLAVGYFLGWYTIGTEVDKNGHQQVEFDVNTPKIKQDLANGRERAKDIIAGGQETKGTPVVGTPPTVTPPAIQTPAPGQIIVRPVSNTTQPGTINWWVAD